MTVDQNGAAACFLFVVRPNHRMPRGGTKFGGQTDLGQFFHQPMPALSYLFRVLIVSRDDGATDKDLRDDLRAWVDGSDANAFVIPRGALSPRRSFMRRWERLPRQNL